jgi:hypothetical protein
VNGEGGWCIIGAQRKKFKVLYNVAPCLLKKKRHDDVKRDTLTDGRLEGWHNTAARRSVTRQV